MVRRLAVVLMVLAPLSACGSDTDSAPDASSGSDASSDLSEGDRAVVEDLTEVLADDPDFGNEQLEQAAELSADAVEAAVAIDLAPCDLVTAAEVEAITGYAVREVRAEGPITCVFDLDADSDLSLLTSVDDAQGRLGGPAAIFQWHTEEGADSPYEQIDDVGERAIYASRGLVVDAGDGRYFSVGVSGQYLEFTEALDEMIALADLALERI